MRLSAENLRLMEQKEPQVAAAFQKFITKMLSERLLKSTKTLEALME